MSEHDAPREHDLETARALALALAGAWLGFAVLSAIASAWPAVLVEVIGAGLSLALLRAARGGALEVDTITHALCAITALSLFALALLSGQGDSQAWWQIALVPALAASLLGTRGVLTWVVPAGALIGAVHASELLVEIPPAYEPTSWMRSLGGVVLTGVVLGYVVYTHGDARRHLRNAGERERTIAAQAAALSDAQLAIEAARDDALRALRHKSEFLATLSHELRAPLNGMLGISSVLLESKLTPQQTELVRTMHQSASSMRKILNDVLDLSRIESGRLELREESVDLRELVGEVLDVFAPAAADKGIELAAIVSADVFATVRLDAVRFGQVLTNLVSNAVKFTSEGEVVVTVERRGPRLRVTVRDTGVGIAREERERLFRPFEQTASGETSREIGSGLGLWISQRIVDSMGGVIGLEEVPRGTAFYVEWEAARGDPPPRDSTEIRVGVRILAVEDSEASARSLEAIAAGLAIEVTIARSIAEATKLAPSLGEPHAVLVDATLPGVTPVAAAEALRALPVLRRLPTVCAVPPSAAQMRGGVEAPFVATTLKPYRASRLTALLGELLSARPSMPTPVSVAPWRPLDVLVVDDDSTNRLVAKLLLERAGLHPHLAGSGEEALSLLASRHFDVVLLDLHMSGIDGLETARRIRAELDPSGRLWIVALTASIYDEDRQRCLDAGMDDFIPKPIEIGLFRAALERAQRAARRRSSASVTSVPTPTDEGVTLRTLATLAEALGDVGEVALLIEEYAESSEGSCRRLREAVAAGDAVGVERAAHTLASSSGQLGARRLEQIARTIEREARGGALPTAARAEAVARERQAAIVLLQRRLTELMDGA